MTVGYHRATWNASEGMSAATEPFADLVAACLLPVVGLFLTGAFFALGFAGELATALATAA